MSGPTDVRKDQASAAGDKTSAANAAKTKKPMPFKRTYFGLGLWNVYFICKFALAYAGYLRLDLLLNAVFFLFVLIPVTGKWLNGLRQIPQKRGVAFVCQRPIKCLKAIFQTEFQQIQIATLLFLASGASRPVPGNDGRFPHLPTPVAAQ